MSFSLDGRGWLASVDAGRREWLKALCSRAAALGMRVALVGGFVRDRLLGITPDDFDLVIEGDATTLSRDLEISLGGRLRVHRPFGTATWQAPDHHVFDLASARQEQYASPAALPTVSLGATLEQDLARRDFTINAMALPLTVDGVGGLVDPFNGRADLAAGILRVLHPQSFRDDPTRLFRAARYAARYGLALDDASSQQVAAGIAHLPALSGDRIRHELALIAVEPTAAGAMTFLMKHGLLPAIHPALSWSAGVDADWASLDSVLAWIDGPQDPDLTRPEVALACLLALALRHAHDADAGAGDAWGRALARINPSAVVARAVMECLDVPADESPPTRPSDVVTRLDAFGSVGVLTLAVARPGWRAAADTYWSTWRHVRPTLTGADLIARGLRPGPRFRQLLGALRVALLDGEITTEQEATWLERALAEGSDAP